MHGEHGCKHAACKQPGSNAAGSHGEIGVNTAPSPIQDTDTLPGDRMAHRIFVPVTVPVTPNVTITRMVSLAARNQLQRSGPPVRRRHSADSSGDHSASTVITSSRSNSMAENNSGTDREIPSRSNEDRGVTAAALADDLLRDLSSEFDSVGTQSM